MVSETKNSIKRKILRLSICVCNFWHRNLTKVLARIFQIRMQQQYTFLPNLTPHYESIKKIKQSKSRLISYGAISSISSLASLVTARGTETSLISYLDARKSQITSIGIIQSSHSGIIKSSMAFCHAALSYTNLHASTFLEHASPAARF